MVRWIHGQNRGNAKDREWSAKRKRIPWDRGAGGRISISGIKKEHWTDEVDYPNDEDEDE